jgi:ribosome biogenesis GTPase / thiamine phosphate phosphatase
VLNTKKSAKRETEMKPEDLGYYDELEKLRKKHNLNDLEIGRVISEHKERALLI